MRLRLPLLVAILALPIVACAAESSPMATTESRTGDADGDGGPATGSSDAGYNTPTDAVGRLAPGVLFVHGS
jgi:hypothetical protein